MLEKGMKAPEFTLQDKNGNEISLKDFAGQKVVLYFYSKDNTSGCTKQACAFAQNYGAFEEKNIPVIGISKDSAESHAKFADKHQLPFVLLSDPERTVHQAYDVLKEKTNDKTKIYLLNDFDKVLSLDLVEGAKKLNETKEEAAELDDFAKYVEEQIALRVEAKKAKNFAEADRIRDELASKGVTLLDTREGTKWTKE